MTQTEMDENLLVVAALEGYSYKYHMDSKNVYKLFEQNNIFRLLRSQYEVLHTQSLDECLAFAEDILERKR